MTVKELRAYLDKFPDAENVRFSAADVKKRDVWPNCQIGSRRISGPMPMICLELHERFWWSAEDGRWSGMWIPVSEKLPETADYVLVSFENFSFPAIGRYEVNDEGDGAWYLQGCDDGDTCCSAGLFVNAWMPLPNPYESIVMEDE